MKKVLCIIISVSLAAFMLAACNGGVADETEDTAVSDASVTTTAKTAPTTAEGPGTEAETDPAGKHYASGTPLELTIHMLAWNKYAFDNEWPVWKKAAEMTNIKLTGTVASTASNSEQAFNVMMLSRVIPDIVCYVREEINKYGKQGAFIPLNDLIEEHAPDIKAYFEIDPDARRYMVSSDGNIYMINYILDGLAAEGWFIRQDWLDKLGLDKPTDIDSFHDVMKAFREEDPNGNGKKDEVPFFAQDSRNGVLDLLAFWGITRFSRADENGRIFYGRYCDRFREAMITIGEWYREGLIDQEIFTRGSGAANIDVREYMFGKNIGGCVHYWFGSTAQFNERASGSIPGFDLEWMPPPGNIDGMIKEWSARQTYMADGWAISADNDYPAETMKFFNFWWTEEGRRLANYGIEGEQYDMAGGKPIFRESVLKSSIRVDDQLWAIGAQLNWGFKMDYDYELQWTSPGAREAISAYIDNGWIVPEFPSLSFTEEERLRMDEISEPIFTYANEMTVNWIIGNESVEETWDEYTRRLRDELHIDEFLQIQQDAYDRYLQN